MDRPSLLIDQAADRLRVSRRTVYNWIRSGRVETRKAGTSRRVYADTLPRRDASGRLCWPARS
jgi:excisionase family DNA binding protein